MSSPTATQACCTSVKTRVIGPRAYLSISSQSSCCLCSCTVTGTAVLENCFGRSLALPLTHIGLALQHECVVLRLASNAGDDEYSETPPTIIVSIVSALNPMQHSCQHASFHISSDGTEAPPACSCSCDGRCAPDSVRQSGVYYGYE